MEEEIGGDICQGVIHLDTEWSTREKLAIASYVLRSDEQHWSGVGRLLRPLGEKERPADWFSPKFCAQQYTALLQQLDAPKRRRSSERADSSENIQPGETPEEAIVSRLTKERIEELKKQLRSERTEYRKLNRQIELIESGALDDDLDSLLNEIENEGKEIESYQDDILEDSMPSQDEIERMVQSAAEEMRTEIEKLQNSTLLEENTLVTDVEVKGSENLLDTVDESQTEETTRVLGKNTSEKDEGDQIMDESADPPLSKIIVPSEDETTLNKADNTNWHNRSMIVKEDTELASESDIIVPENLVPETDDITNNSQQTELKENVIQLQNPLSVSLLSKLETVVDSSKDDEDPTLHKVSLNDESLISEIAEESDNTFNYTVDESTLNSMSLPGTPHTGSLVFDSFPSSPALSHSSDMDPDSTTSWKAWRKSIMILWKQVASHRFASLFLQPVTDDIAPNYSTTVYRNMDLSALKKNVETGAIRTTKDFHRDLMLMFQNAIMYNNREHDVYKMTMQMQKDVMDQVAQFMSTQMIAETTQLTANKSLRRSTMRRAVLSEKVGEFRTRRSAAAETDSKSTH